MTPRSPTLSRRRFAELVGAGVIGSSAGIPLLGTPRTARGQASAFPKRLIVLIGYNGTVPDAWRPVAAVPELVLGRIHEPLEPHKKDILLVNGLRNRAGSDSKYAGCGTHCSFANVLTGRANIGEGKHGGISVDQFVAQQIGAKNRFRSIEAKLGPSNMNASVSASGPQLGKEASANLYAIFDRLFGELKLPADEQERLRFSRKSVLDRNGKRTETLVANLVGGDAKLKLGAYHAAIRELELALDARSNPTCAVPADIDSANKLDLTSSKNIPLMAKAHIDTLVASLTCDLTRVYTLEFFDSGHGVVFPADFITDLPSLAGKPRGDGHYIAHESAGPTKEQKIAFERWQAAQLGYLIERLKAVKEGSGTLFDNAMIMQLQTMAHGSHAPNPLPAVLSGGAAGWKLGRSLVYGPTDLRPSSEYPLALNDLMISICQGMGIEAKTFGEPEYCKGPLAGLHG